MLGTREKHGGTKMSSKNHLSTKIWLDTISVQNVQLAEVVAWLLCVSHAQHWKVGVSE